MSPPKSVLFVCVENSCRSQIAEAFARIVGENFIEPYSAGSRPSGQINPKAIETMHELDYDLSNHQSKSLAEIPDIEYQYVITMGCGDVCPTITAKYREDWQIPDPKHLSPAEFRKVRDMIAEKVKTLLAKISLA